MHLRDYLHDIPLKALKAIARALEVEVAYEARIKLINAIDRSFWDGSLVERLLSRLTPEHRSLLSLVAFCYDTGAPENLLLRKAERLTGLTRLAVCALVDDLMLVSLVGCIDDGEHRYFCPRGIGEQVRRTFLGTIGIPETERRPAPGAGTPNLLEDVMSLLALVYTSEVGLTLTGAIKKTALERAFAGSLTCKNNGSALSESARNDLVSAYLTERGLIELDHRRARTTERLSGWLDLSMTERFHDMTVFAGSHVLHDSSAAAILIGILGETAAGDGFAPSELAAFLHTNTLFPGSASRVESRTATFLQVLHQLGLLAWQRKRFVVTQTGERFFNYESLPIDESISGEFTIQPNFEVIVGPELDPRVRFQLELMADRKNRDMVNTYEVSRQGIARARERGMSIDQVRAFFDTHARNDIPQNVVFSIESWAEEYGSISFQDAVLMRFRDRARCDAVAHMPELAPYIRERVGDTALIVAPDHIETLTALLRDGGFHPEPYGPPAQDNARSGDKFIPRTISKMLESIRLPELDNEFFFPGSMNGEATDP